MNIEKLIALINLQPQMKEKLALQSKDITMQEIDAYLEELMNIETAPKAHQYLREYFSNDFDKVKLLYCHLVSACRIYEKYQEKSIPDTIFIDTMKCFTRFITECEIKTGHIAFDRAWWTYRQISMNLFRIGELEYQFKEYEGEPVIALHIPSDADFRKEAIDQSIKQAEEFFHLYYPEYQYTKYTCNSWLLSPLLKTILPSNSNILDFQNRFTIVGENKEDREYIEWLFQKPMDTDIDKLPERTSLQQNVKKLIMQGENIGVALGTIG